MEKEERTYSRVEGNREEEREMKGRWNRDEKR